MGEDEVIEKIGDALSLCASTGLPQQVNLDTNQGPFIVVVMRSPT